jgi:type II secretory pathway pseudopilin PulG
MNLPKVLSLAFLVIAIGLGYLLYSGIQDEVKQEKRVALIEAAVIEKLQMLREAQLAYQASNGAYANNWNDLKKFISEGKIWIVQRTETTKLLEYGKEEITVKYDTLGFANVTDSLFNDRKYPDFNLEALAVVPGSGGKMFEFFADKVERNQYDVNVFEIRDPAPVNPERKLNNNEKALKVGSRTDASTEGNWK